MLTPQMLPSRLKPFYAALRFAMTLFAGTALFVFGVAKLAQLAEEPERAAVRMPACASGQTLTWTRDSWTCSEPGGLTFDNSITATATNEIVSFSNVEGTTFSSNLSLDPHRIISTATSKPRLESCGSGAYLSANATDSGGRIHVGDVRLPNAAVSFARECNLIFGQQWPTPPHCVFSEAGSAVGAGVARLAPSSSIVDYVCLSL